MPHNWKVTARKLQHKSWLNPQAACITCFENMDPSSAIKSVEIRCNVKTPNQAALRIEFRGQLSSVARSKITQAHFVGFSKSWHVGNKGVPLIREATIAEVDLLGTNFSTLCNLFCDTAYDPLDLLKETIDPSTKYFMSEHQLTMKHSPSAACNICTYYSEILVEDFLASPVRSECTSEATRRLLSKRLPTP